MPRVQDRRARVCDCPCRSLPRGARMYQIFYVLIVLISKKNYNSRTWQNAFFARFAPAARDLPPLPAIRIRRPGCPFHAIRPPALNNFRHPWLHAQGTIDQQIYFLKPKVYFPFWFKVMINARIDDGPEMCFSCF